MRREAVPFPDWAIIKLYPARFGLPCRDSCFQFLYRRVVTMNVQAKPSFLEELNEAILTGSQEGRQRALWHATDMLMVGR